MINNKVLIFYNYGSGVNVGGPMGFVNQNIEGVDSQYFTYPNQLRKSKKYTKVQIVKNYLKTKKDELWDIKHDLIKCKISTKSVWYPMACSTIRKFKEIEAGNFKYIYFHDMYSFQACLHLIHQDQHVIFQPHSPEQMSKETSYFSNLEDDYNWALMAEKNIFLRANTIVLPNEYTISIYKNLINTKSNIEFIISGCQRKNSFKKYPLSESKINLLFIGRRTEIKGFDVMVEAFKLIQAKRNDINLLFLGGGCEVKGENIYDIGFSNTPENWINSVDYVINTNRQSYFDLTIMETLSVGTPILMTSTEGHKMFIEDMSEGIIDIGQACVEKIAEKITSLELKKREHNQNSIDNNQLLYSNKYSHQAYIKRLNEFCKKLINA